jgi:hypothetical protein
VSSPPFGGSFLPSALDMNDDEVRKGNGKGKGGGDSHGEGFFIITGVKRARRLKGPGRVADIVIVLEKADTVHEKSRRKEGEGIRAETYYLSAAEVS